jgi:hypothetical protein
MIQFSDREISNEQLVLDSATEMYYLGHDLTLRNCTLIIKVPARALVMARTRMVACTIDARRELKNFQWDAVHLEGCRFRGRFHGNDFGERSHSSGLGSIAGCDFSEALLSGTRFLACDAMTFRLPSWPCFTLFNPRQRAAQLRELPWPGRIGQIVIAGFSEYPLTTSAVTYSATELAKKYGGTPEEIRAVVETLDGAFY